MKKLNAFLATVAIALLTFGSVQAQNEQGQADTSLRIATGKKGKGYSKLLADMQAVCGGKVAMSEVETEGGLQNLTILAANQADLGFVQLDTLQDMKSTDEAIGNLLAVLPLNSNLLHIVALSEGYKQVGARTWGGLKAPEATTIPLESLSSLKGLPVALVGSSQKLVRMLDRRNNLGMSFTDVDTDDQALAMVKVGHAAAMFSSSGWPSGVVGKLKRESGLKLLGFDLPVQAPYQVVRKNYNNLGAYNVGFLAAPNVLVSRPFKVGGVNGKAVTTLQACISKNLVNLQEGRYEPAWAEVKSLGDTSGWPRFSDSSRR